MVKGDSKGAVQRGTYNNIMSLLPIKRHSWDRLTLSRPSEDGDLHCCHDGEDFTLLQQQHQVIIKLHFVSQVIVQKQQMYLGAKTTTPGKSGRAYANKAIILQIPDGNPFQVTNHIEVHTH
jgi:hypothetical protein